MTAGVPASERLIQAQEGLIDLGVLVGMTRTLALSLDAGAADAEGQIQTLQALLRAIEVLCSATLGVAEGGTDGGSGDEE